MELADNPKLDMDAGLEENMGTPKKISILDHLNGFQYSTEKSDNFVIDMGTSFSHAATNNKDINSNSRITLQRSLSRKGSLRVGGGGGGGGGGGDKKIISNHSPNDRDIIVAASSSPRGSSMPEKASLGTTDHPNSSNAQVHHQITITTSGSMNGSPTEGRSGFRRNSFKRSSLSWTVDPKRVLFFFATLSSMGTMLLIYFTLSMRKFRGEDGGLD